MRARAGKVKEVLTEYAVPGVPKPFVDAIYDDLVIVLRKMVKKAHAAGQTLLPTGFADGFTSYYQLSDIFGGNLQGTPDRPQKVTVLILPTDSPDGFSVSGDTDQTKEDFPVQVLLRITRTWGSSPDRSDYRRLRKMVYPDLYRAVQHEIGHLQRFVMMGKPKVDAALKSYPFKRGTPTSPAYIFHPLETDTVISTMVGAYRNARKKPKTVEELVRLAGYDHWLENWRRRPSWRKKLMGRLHREGVPLPRWS